MQQSTHNDFGRGDPAALRLRIDLAYVGSDFFGWQIQTELRTVQGELTDALTRLLGRRAVPVGAGRTDTGVHARCQVAHLGVNSPEEVERVMRALPSMVPRDISIVHIRPVPGEFNACRTATARRYSYHLLEGRDIFRPHCWQLGRRLDRQAMDQAAKYLLGRHDFTSFCKARSQKEGGNLCNVDLCKFEWAEDSAIFHVRANRFLHHMVRIVISLLVETGLGVRSAGEVQEILQARRRDRAGKMAPPQGLFLEEVSYPADLQADGQIER